MNERDRATLRRIVEHARKAIEYANTTDWRDDERTVDAIVTRIAQIGENASETRLSSSAQDEVADVPWPQIRAMRSRVVHGYDFIDLDILATTVANDLPELVRNIEVALATG